VYQYELFINGQPVKLSYTLKFQTRKLWQWREDPPDFNFVTGSCTYVNDPPYDRPGKPYGENYEIFTTIYKQQPDMMLWLGDNTYLRETDWYSRSGILYRHTHTRSLAELQPLLGSVHHYAIWDDHDYGPDNSDRSFRQKKDALEAFKLFWGNPAFGVNNQPGTATMFQWADVDFFLLDNRYYHSPNNRASGKRTLLGEEQVSWLIDALTASEASFKFIVVGGQFLNPVTYGENFSTFPEERSKILRLISRENISGIIFLTGDRHHTELSKLERENLYPLYDLTVSPLTSAPNPQHIEEHNFLRVPKTFVGERNFARLNVTGPGNNRLLKIAVFDKSGTELWTRAIKANDLK
jgi:alkaline phosphatase D